VRTKADNHIRRISKRTGLPTAAARDDYMDQVRQDMNHFNALDQARAPGEIRVEIVDHVISDEALLWRVEQALEPNRLVEPPSDEFCNPIDEGIFLRNIGLFSNDQ